MKERPLVGCFVTFALPDIAEYTAALGFDFLLIDNEHGVMEQSVLADMVRASQCADVPAVIRCTEKSYDHIQKALDFGANGIQLPLVNNAEDAKKVVDLANFPPDGKRGVAFLPRAASFGLVQDKKAYLKQANESKLISCQVETKEALDNLDEILAVEGIDVYFIGPGDLSTSLGMNTTDPEFLAIVEKTIKNCRLLCRECSGRKTGYGLGREVSGNSDHPVYGGRRKEVSAGCTDWKRQRSGCKGCLLKGKKENGYVEILPAGKCNLR